MAFVTGSYGIRSLAPECKFCGSGFQPAEVPKRSLYQIVCCQDPEIEIEAVAHRVGNVYHAFHPACFPLFVQDRANPKCLHCDAPILSLDGQPIIPPAVQDPDEALLNAAGSGDIDTVRRLLGEKHRFHQGTIDQAAQIAASFDHSAIVAEILRQKGISSRARTASLEFARTNINHSLEELLTTTS